jgi:CheY-like chemotaxis protein
MNDKQRILVVDDEPQITRVLRRSLTTRGYDVRVAADGLAALQTFGDWPPDLIVTDLSMPYTDGLQLCRNLRAISQVPIIVLSVRGEEKTKVEALDAGADDYVTKPFGMDELLARIRAALRRFPAAKSEEAAPALEVGEFRVDLEHRSVAGASTSPGRQGGLRVEVKDMDREQEAFREWRETESHVKNLYALTRRHGWTWQAVVAVSGICGGALAAAIGSLLSAFARMRGDETGGLSMHGVGSVLLLSTIPLLMLGAHSLDLLDRKVEQRQPARKRSPITKESVRT